MKRMISLIAAVLLLIPLAACGSDAPDVPDGTSAPADTTAPAETVPAETERKDAKDNLPADFQLNGKTVTTLARDAGRKKDWDGIGEESGDVIMDAVYHRTMSVAERLKVNFQYLEAPTNWQDFGRTMEQVIMAGDNAAQIVLTPGNASIQSGRDFLFQPMQESKYLDFQQPWWNLAAMEEMSLDGINIRYMSGDMLLTQFDNSGAIFFNKALYEDNGFKSEDLYQTVIDRKWTVDVLRTQAAAMYKDVNGDGTEDEGDIYGYATFTKELVKFFDYGADIQRFRRDENGYPVIAYDTERAETAVNILIDFLHNTKGVKYGDKANNLFFPNGITVFCGSSLGMMSQVEMREMKSPYGVIPFPMLDSNQKEYTNFIHNSANYVAVPVTVPNAEEIGGVLEALASESYRSVVEVYFETALKAKYSSDSQSGKCIDIIRAVSKKSFIADYNAFTNKLGFIITDQAVAGKNTFSSTYAASIEAANKKVLETVEKSLATAGN